MSAITKAIGALLLATSLSGPVTAQGLAGDYLAARQARFAGDFEAAAKYFGRAIEADPQNPQLLENAVLANMSLADFDRAGELADRMREAGLTQSRLADMARLVRDARGENYDAILKAVNEQRGVGPLADGVIEAWAELGRGDMSGAIVAFDEAAKMQGLAEFATYHKAMAMASVGDFESAGALLDAETAGAMQMNRRGIIARAQILGQLDRQSEAVTLIDDAFGDTLDPELARLRETLAAGNTPEFTHVRTARDGMAEVFYTLALMMGTENGADLILLHSRMAEYIRPGFTDAILLSAEILEDMGQHELAVETYAQVPQDDPAYHAAELGRVAALRAQDQIDAAERVLHQLEETNGDLPVVHTTLGDLLRQQGRYEEAAKAYTRAIDLSGEIGEREWFLFYVRGTMYERTGDWGAAEADFRRALDLNPGQPQVLNYLGYSMVEKRENLDEALGMIEQAIEAQPEAGYIIDSLGWALYRLGRYDEAVGHMERAAELMPVDPVVNDHLGDVYWAVGRKLEAEFQWKRALSFALWEGATEEVDPDRIRRKLEVGLDQVLAEEGAPPLSVAEGD